ncbi:hypothetical protein HHI36_008221 [Cryptolaemus montrouzieri]|uniref:Uncharacterized protein n=1 Tax=Cryptolaemus montrouzieri TaxID=559131 RepID=A0ABD2MSR6_9CUCU
MYNQDLQKVVRNFLIQIFDQQYLFNYLKQQGVFYRGTYEKVSIENVLEYILNNQGIFDKTVLIELIKTPILRNILVEQGVFNKYVVQQILYVLSSQGTYDPELLEQLVNRQALKYQLINQGIFKNYIFTQIVVRDVLTNSLYQKEFYGQEQLVQLVKNSVLRNVLVQQGIFNENVLYKLLNALNSQTVYTQTLLRQLVNKQVLRNILIQQGIVDYTVLDQLVNNEILGLKVLLKIKSYQQTPRTSYKQLFGVSSNIPEFTYGQGYPHGQNFVGINFEKTIVKPVNQEYPGIEVFSENQREFYPTEYNRFNPWFYGQNKISTGINKMDYLKNIIYGQQGGIYQGQYPTQGFQGYYAQFPGYYNYQGSQGIYGQYPVEQQIY